MAEAPGTVSLTCLVITKNEEANLPECLDSVRWANEVIVVDAESTDRTVEIARRYTDRVFVRPWAGFGPQKNFGIDRATSEWILILDADERVTTELHRELQGCVERWKSGMPTAYQVPRRNFYYGKWVRRAGVYPDYQARLFRRGAARYNDVGVHENLIVGGAVGTLSGHLDHYTERRISDHFKKFGMYTTLAAREKAKVVTRVHWSDMAFRPLVILFKTLIFKQGFRDGVHGLIVCVFASMYTFVKYAKLWDLTRQPSPTSDVRW